MYAHKHTHTHTIYDNKCLVAFLFVQGYCWRLLCWEYSSTAGTADIKKEGEKECRYPQKYFFKHGYIHLWRYLKKKNVNKLNQMDFFGLEIWWWLRIWVGSIGWVKKKKTKKRFSILLK